MTYSFLSVLLVAAYVFFMIDWNEFRAVMKQGGWATICIFIIVGLAVVYTIACPEAGGHTAGGHH